jgi:hypothetical protein
MPRDKASKRRSIFLYQGGHALLVHAYGEDAAVAFRRANRFLKHFRASNRRRAAA